MVTATNSEYLGIKSDDKMLMEIGGKFVIWNDRTKDDRAYLPRVLWQGMK